MPYKREPIPAPRLNGKPLQLFVELVESPAGRAVIGKILSDAGFEHFRKAQSGNLTPTPPMLPTRGKPPSEIPSVLEQAHTAARIAGNAGVKLESIQDFADAYRSGVSHPTAVAAQAVAAMRRIDDGKEPLRAFISSKEDDVMTQARESSERFRAGKQLSILDGVPIAVKDEVDQAPYPTTVGTSFMGELPAARDCTVVARLRAAGAVLIGKTNMHEVGIGITGVNPHHGPARNPHNPAHVTGGSSSGSGAAVAAGICPVAVGADGGGSIRIPSGFCGIVGLKPTFGRVSEFGAAPLCWSVAHIGPMGASVRDVAAAYVVMAGEDPADPGTRGQPPVHLSRLGSNDLHGVTLGICRPWFEDADRTVVQRCEAAVEVLKEAGARIKEIEVPDPRVVQWAHTVLITSEMATAVGEHLTRNRRRFGLDARVNLQIGRYFQGHDYVHALRHRHRVILDLLALMHDVDAILSPTTASTAPRLATESLPLGESNVQQVDEVTRFARLANLSGFPAVAVPAGYDNAGLPVSLQMMGRPWEEDLLLQLAHVVEQRVERKLPAVHHTLLRP